MTCERQQKRASLTIALNYIFSRILKPARAIAERTQSKLSWQSICWSAAEPADTQDGYLENKCTTAT
jgi:hypothetical protein